MLLASILAVGNYFLTERVPLSVASSEVISALPAVFAWMVWMVVILLWIFGCPVVVLLTCDRMKALVSAIHPSALQKKSFGSLFWCLVAGWGGASSICFAMIVLVELSGDAVSMALALVLSTLCLSLISLLTVSHGIQREATAAGVLHALIRSETGKVARIFDDLARRCLIVSALQTLFIIFVYVFLHRQGWSSLVALVVILVMALFQCFLGGVFFRMKQRGRQLAAIFWMSLFAVLVASIHPVAANFFVSNVLARQVMGGRDCVILKWTPEAKVLPELVNDRLIHGALDKTTSKPVRILFASSSTIYVRSKDEWDRMRREGDSSNLTYSVPQGAIAGYASCPSKKRD
ncbi:MAG: hypothetical protein Q4B17_14430 [Lautropia sp.]|nr:hypothetical protein [Lautropia sp.]